MAMTFYNPFDEERKALPKADRYKGYEISVGSVVNPNTRLEAIGSIVHTKSQKAIKVKLGEPTWDTFANFIKIARAVIDLAEEASLVEEASKKQAIFTPAFDSLEILKEEEPSEEDMTLEDLEEEEQDLLEDLQDYENEAESLRNRLEELRTRIHAQKFEGFTDSTETSSKEEIKPASSLDSWFESTDTKRWL